MQFKSVTGYRGAMIGAPIEDHGTYVKGIELPCEITFTPGPYCALVDPVVVNFPPSWTGRKWNNNARCFLYDIFPHTYDYHTRIQMEINLQLPNIGLVSSQKSEPGSWTWITGNPSSLTAGSNYGHLHVVVYMVDSRGAFTSLANEWRDSRNVIKTVKLTLGTVWQSTSIIDPMRVNACGFPVVVMEGDDDVALYKTAPTGLYCCTTRLTPFNTDIGPLYGVLLGQNQSVAPRGPSGSTKFMTGDIDVDLDTYSFGLKLELDFDLNFGFPSTYPIYPQPPDYIATGHIINGSTRPTDGSEFSQAYHLGEVIAFDAVALPGYVNDRYGPFPMQ